MHVFCDFDGTISLKDTTDEVLTRFADSSWQTLEEKWKRGEIGSAECMRGQIALIRASQPELDAALDAQQIDSSFPNFVNFCEAAGAPVTVISDGVDYFIRRILSRNGLGRLSVIANCLSVDEGGGYTLSSPHSNPHCHNGAGVCKCSHLAKNRDARVFVGDGRSDFCAVKEADLVFAKDTLATYCEEQNIPYIPYDSFYDVQMVLADKLPGLRHTSARNKTYA